ncbi:MAG TPA: hypothetical protein DCR53_19450 [Afipia sp.]|nr:hypothetical protein [Afipia sp.]
MRDRLTAFGSQCRKFRIQYNLSMGDQAKGLGFSVAYISAIELGKRKIPENYISDLAYWMSLSAPDKDLLEKLAIGDQRTIEVQPKNTEQALLADEFAKSVSRLPAEAVKFLRECLSVARSARYSDMEVRKRALLARTVFNLDDEATFDVLRIVESQLHLVDQNFFLKVDSEKPSQLAIYASSDGKKVDHFVCAEFFYTNADRQTPDSRALLAHEIAHWILHPEESHAYSRPFHPSIVISKSKRIEYEADLFAREFLLPITTVSKYQSPESLARATNVPLWMGELRIKEIARLKDVEREEVIAFATALRKRLLSAAETNVSIEETKQFPTSKSNVVPFPIRSSHQPVSSKKRSKKSPALLPLFEYADKQAAARLNRSIEWFREFGFRE